MPVEKDGDEIKCRECGMELQVELWMGYPRAAIEGWIIELEVAPLENLTLCPEHARKLLKRVKNG